MAKNFDGLYFMPGDSDDELDLSYFEFDGELAEGKKVDSKNPIGDIWQIALFTKNVDGEPVFDDAFEGIFTDPDTYIKNLCGVGLYGCMVRKTDKSINWFNDYLKKVKNNVIIMKLKS